ncbi:MULTISPECIES: hypothetical protein [Flavobacterium]|uniref:hypothetical protein n=1 Tax=Flavobacterium TaxID=237 RepID=UPI002115382A|nr:MULTISPECIES: hypothetical protein [Flavobacterium]UUF16245.1 hypothetical protein NLJ00_09000 [Flavobacterium panici]
MNYLKDIQDIDIESAIIGGGIDFIKIRQKFIYSVLNGEYYFDNCIDILKNLESRLENIISSSLYSELNTNYQVLAHTRYTLLSHFVSHFKYINTTVLNRLLNNYHSKIINFELDFYFKKFNLFEKEETTTIQKFHWLFIANIKLAEFDEGYSVNENNISSLLEIYHKLKIILEKNTVYSLKPLIKITKEKCSILLYKILKRLEKTNSSIYSILNNDLSIEVLEKSIENTNIVEEIKNHYFLNNPLLIENVIHEIKEKLKLNSIEIKDIHKYTKYVKKQKNINNSFISEIKQVNASLEYFLENKIQKSKSTNGYLKDINEITFKSSLSLIYNTNFKIESEILIKNVKNIFSFKDVNIAFERLIEYYDILKNKELKTNPNFILSKLFIEQIVKLLEICDKQPSLVLNNDEDDYLNLLSKVFKKSYDVLSDLKTQIKICEFNRIMPLYLEIEKCKSNSQYFLDSQYILPSNYEHLLNDCENKRDELKRLETIINTITPKNIKDLGKQLKKEVKDQQYSIITVIGLYASFITFILANVNVLPELLKHSIGSVLAFMFVFGIVLFFFITSLKLLFTSNSAFEYIKQKKINYIWLWVISALIAITGTFYILVRYSTTDFNKNNENINSSTTTVIFDPKTGKKQSETKIKETKINTVKRDSI